jgi:uncharacterized iron-regulated membrane protein
MIKKATFHRYTRKTHRWMGVILGIQFLFWTIGGLYFSWSDMATVKSEDRVVKTANFDIKGNWKSPTEIFEKMGANIELTDIKLIQILSTPYYQISFFDKTTKSQKVRLANAKTGDLRTPLSHEEAKLLAQKHLIGQPEVSGIEYLTTTNGHHEYRNNPLPAYAVTFAKPSPVTVYVATELGTVQKLRNNKWRIYDFFWMLHTMDYNTRSNFSNYVIRAFSIFGLFTILSGFVLFVVSRKTKKNYGNA